MTRISTPLFHTRSLNALLDQQFKLSEMQLKISTGKEISSPADDPIASSRLLGLKQQRQDVQRYQTNIDIADGDLSIEEIALKSSTNIIRRLKELTISAGVPRSSSDLQAIKTEIVELKEALLDLANTKNDGEYIFSGAKNLTQTVLKDINGNYLYQGDETVKNLNIGPAVDVQINDTGKEIFFGIPTNDINLSSVSGEVAVTAANPGLVAVTTLGALGANELTLNGITIAAATSDGVSTTDATASAIATAAAINATTSKHGVVATTNANTFDFGVGTYTTNALAAGDFTINGTQITGAPATADAAGLAALITTFNISGVTASGASGNLVLTASDGRNIQLTSDGTTASGTTFANFDINGGAALDQVKRSTVTLNDHQSITIAGSTPGDVGFTAGTYNVTANSGTATITTPYIQQARPENSSPDENYRIVFDTAGTFSVYRESDPFTRITDFIMYNSGENIGNAETPIEFPTTYTTGDTIIVDGVQVTISGTPVAGDVFNIDLDKVETRNVFQSIDNLITAINDNSGDPQRFSYEIGTAITNMDNSLSRISDVRSRLGARLSLAETQKGTNDEFEFFSTKSISLIEDLDYISAISELVQHQVSLQAAQRSIVQVQRLSLFDYI